MIKLLMTLVLTALGIEGPVPEDTTFCDYLSEETAQEWTCRDVRQWFADNGLEDVLDDALDAASDDKSNVSEDSAGDDSAGSQQTSISNGF